MTNRLFFAVVIGKLVSVVGLLIMPVLVGAMLDGLRPGEAEESPEEPSDPPMDTHGL